MQAGIAALEGRTAEAVALYGRALNSWRALTVTWDEALTGLDMVRALDPAVPEVQTVAVSTREIFERLRAAPYVAMLDEALARKPAATRAESARRDTPLEAAASG
jgi:hypothetical protein